MRIEKFIEHINQLYDIPVSAQDAADAFRNFSGFMGVLFRINERVGLIGENAPNRHIQEEKDEK